MLSLTSCECISWNSINVNSWLGLGSGIGFGEVDVQWTIRKTELEFQQTICKSLSRWTIQIKCYPIYIYSNWHSFEKKFECDSILYANNIKCCGPDHLTFVLKNLIFVFLKRMCCHIFCNTACFWSTFVFNQIVWLSTLRTEMWNRSFWKRTIPQK